MIIPLYSGLARPHLKFCAHYGKDAGKLEGVQWRGTKVVREKENILFEERLRN